MKNTTIVEQQNRIFVAEYDNLQERKEAESSGQTDPGQVHALVTVEVSADSPPWLAAALLRAIANNLHRQSSAELAGLASKLDSSDPLYFAAMAAKVGREPVVGMPCDSGVCDFDYLAE